MKISISNLNYTILDELSAAGTPATDTSIREYEIPETVVQELNLTDESYQEIGQYLVENLSKELGHPVSGIAWEVIKNVVPFKDGFIDIESSPVT